MPRADSLPAGRADRVNRSRRASAHHRRGPKDPRRTRHHPRLARSRRPLDASPPPRDRDRADRGHGTRILSNLITLRDFLIDRFTLFVNNLSVKHTHLGDKPMDPRGNSEVRRPRFGDLRFRQSVAAISSLNEAWFHILDEYVIDTPLNEVLLPLLRNCFFWRSSLRGFVAAEGSWRTGRCRYRRLHYRRARVVTREALGCAVFDLTTQT